MKNDINEFKDSKGHYAWSRQSIGMMDEYKPWEEPRFFYYKYDLRKKSRIKINKEQYHLAYKNLKKKKHERYKL
jgi:hypothetical protein